MKHTSLDFIEGVFYGWAYSQKDEALEDALAQKWTLIKMIRDCENDGCFNQNLDSETWLDIAKNYNYHLSEREHYNSMYADFLMVFKNSLDRI